MAVFRVEKTKDYTVMANHHLRNTQLSLKAKGLLSLMLSLPEDWDYTTKGLSCICKDGVDSICSTVKELEDHGYITRTRLRDEMGRLRIIEYTIHEQPIEGKSPKRENPVLDNPVLENPRLGEPVLGNPAQLNTKQSSTKILNTNPSIDTDPAMPDEEWEAYSEFVEENIEYDTLIQEYDRETVDEIRELILEMVTSTKRTFHISGNKVSWAAVKSRFLKLGSEHVKYVLDCLRKNTTKVHNVKKYLIATLYNAPSTMESYYQLEVGHDMRKNE